MSTTPPNRPPKSPAGSAHDRIVSVEAFSGPLPPPQLLKGYDDACPGASDRIIKMAEEQGAHRRKMEELAVSTTIENMRRDYAEARFGQSFGFAAVLAMIAAGVIVVLKGHPISGTILGGSGFSLQLVNTFVRGRKQSDPEPVQEKKDVNVLPPKKTVL